MLDTTVPLLLKGLWETVFMTFTSGFFGFLLGVIASKENNKDQEKVKNFVKAYQSEAVVKAAEKVFRGGAVRGW